MQCTYTIQQIDELKKYLDETGVKANLILVDSLAKAKKLPCAFNNWAVFYKGKFVTINLLFINQIEKLLNS